VAGLVPAIFMSTAGMPGDPCGVSGLVPEGEAGLDERACDPDPARYVKQCCPQLTMTRVPTRTRS
jgi:hypothetical protein